MMDLDNIFGKRKKGKKIKDPFANIFPKSKSMGPLIPRFKKQRSIIPSIGMPQQRFLKRTSGMKQRFTDHDRDGVVSGLDCFPFNRKKHGDLPGTYNVTKRLSPEEKAQQLFKKEQKPNLRRLPQHVQRAYEEFDDPEEGFGSLSRKEQDMVVSAEERDNIFLAQRKHDKVAEARAKYDRAERLANDLDTEDTLSKSYKRWDEYKKAKEDKNDN